MGYSHNLWCTGILIMNSIGVVFNYKFIENTKPVYINNKA